MVLRCALAGATTTAVLVAAVGNPPVVEAAHDNGTALAATVSRFVSWDVLDAPADVVGLAVVRIAVLVVLVGVLSGIAGRSRSRSAAWLAGWAAVVVAGAAAAAAAYSYQVAVILDGRTIATSYADGLVLAVNGGAAFGLWTGWFVGLVTAVAAATRRAGDHATSAPGGQRRGAAPPPPWWAPTHDPADTALHPGPTAYPPGGLPATRARGRVGSAPGAPQSPPVAAVNGMAAASDDPRPSDPGATSVIGVPGGDDADSAPGDDSRSSVDDGTASTGAEADRSDDAGDAAPDDSGDDRGVDRGEGQQARTGEATTGDESTTGDATTPPTGAPDDLT
jgi:hypothetical protein